LPKMSHVSGRGRHNSKFDICLFSRQLLMSHFQI
jgi:hypothetical protein